MDRFPVINNFVVKKIVNENVLIHFVRHILSDQTPGLGGSQPVGILPVN